MALTLYGGLNTRAGRNLWALEELGLSYEWLPLQPALGQTRTPEFLALNPLGKVPVLVDGDFVLTESIAINLYLTELALAAGGTPLWPATVQGRARCHQWASWATTELEYALTVMVRELRRAAGAGTAPDAALLQTCLQGCEDTMVALEVHLSHQPWVAGDTFTLGDLNTAFSVNFVAGRIAMARFPHAQAWLARCLARPAWQRVLALQPPSGSAS